MLPLFFFFLSRSWGVSLIILVFKQQGVRLAEESLRICWALEGGSWSVGEGPGSRDPGGVASSFSSCFAVPLGLFLFIYWRRA